MKAVFLAFIFLIHLVAYRGIEPLLQERKS